MRPNTLPERAECVKCGSVFVPRSFSHKFCTVECRQGIKVIRCRRCAHPFWERRFWKCPRSGRRGSWLVSPACHDCAHCHEYVRRSAGFEDFCCDCFLGYLRTRLLGQLTECCIQCWTEAEALFLNGSECTPEHALRTGARCTRDRQRLSGAQRLEGIPTPSILVPALGHREMIETIELLFRQLLNVTVLTELVVRDAGRRVDVHIDRVLACEVVSHSKFRDEAVKVVPLLRHGYAAVLFVVPSRRLTAFRKALARRFAHLERTRWYAVDTIGLCQFLRGECETGLREVYDQLVQPREVDEKSA